AQAWVVRKPTTDGVVTSLDLFDEAGDPIAAFYGAPRPGRPEIDAWRELLELLPTADEPAPTPAELEPV
ncbi:MAG TPA: ChuX/HutX family heme-like substrate-binding protein, partial [Nannocystis sp.]